MPEPVETCYYIAPVSLLLIKNLNRHSQVPKTVTARRSLTDFAAVAYKPAIHASRAWRHLLPSATILSRISTILDMSSSALSLFSHSP